MFDLLAPSFLFHLILACIVAKRTETCKMLMKQKKSFDSLILMWIAKSFFSFYFVPSILLIEQKTEIASKEITLL